MQSFQVQYYPDKLIHGVLDPEVKENHNMDVATTITGGEEFGYLELKWR